MSDLISITEYSQLRGCSVSAVYKRLNKPNNKIQQYVVREGKNVFLKTEILEAEGLARKDPEDTPHSTTAPITAPITAPKEVEKVEEPGIGALALQILEQQLAQKDKEIEELNRRLEEATRHEREMADRVAELASQANELQRNSQILIAQAQQQPALEEPKKPGLFKRLFK